METVLFIIMIAAGALAAIFSLLGLTKVRANESFLFRHSRTLAFGSLLICFMAVCFFFSTLKEYSAIADVGGPLRSVSLYLWGLTSLFVLLGKDRPSALSKGQFVVLSLIFYLAQHLLSFVLLQEIGEHGYLTAIPSLTGYNLLILAAGLALLFWSWRGEKKENK
jgi:hypothetical protein